MSAEDVIYIGAALFAAGIGLFLISWTSTTFIDKFQNSSAVNGTSADTALQAVEDNVINKFDYIIFGFFIALVLGLLITSWLIGANPLFMFVYFIVVTIGVVISTILSNVWESITRNPKMVATVAAFPITDHLMTYLPLYMGVVGVVGIIIMYAKPYMLGEEGSGL
jgi:hypothetical protein